MSDDSWSTLVKRHKKVAADVPDGPSTVKKPGRPKKRTNKSKTVTEVNTQPDW